MVLTPDISQALDRDQRLCQRFLVTEPVLHHVGKEGLGSKGEFAHWLLSTRPGSARKQTPVCCKDLSLFSSSAISQDSLQLYLGKWRGGGLLKAKLPLSVIITGNNNTRFIVKTFCIRQPCGVGCIHSAHHSY